MSYRLHARDGRELGHRDDLHDAIRYARAVSEARGLSVEVSDEAGIVLAVCSSSDATAHMRDVRRRNFDRQVSKPIAPEQLDRCGDHATHDWIWFSREPDRIYQCRMCSCWGGPLRDGKVDRIRCTSCPRWAIRALVGQRPGSTRPRWVCEVHDHA